MAETYGPPLFGLRNPEGHQSPSNCLDDPAGRFPSRAPASRDSTPNGAETPPKMGISTTRAAPGPSPKRLSITSQLPKLLTGIDSPPKRSTDRGPEPPPFSPKRVEWCPTRTRKTVPFKGFNRRVSAEGPKTNCTPLTKLGCSSEHKRWRYRLAVAFTDPPSTLGAWPEKRGSWSMASSRRRLNRTKIGTNRGHLS